MFRLSFANFLLIHFLHFSLSTSAYVITTQPWQTDRPAPGLTLFYDIQVEQNDPVLVDILLFNGSLGNTTVIFGNNDLTKKDDRNAGFDIPFVPPGTTYAIRLVETSTKRFLQDSPQFQIFAVGSASGSTSSASSVPPTTLPTPSGMSISSTKPPSSTRAGGTTTTSSSTPSSTAAVTSTIGASKSSKVGAIVGAVNGCVVIIVIAFAIIIWRRYRRRPKLDNPTNETENALPKPASNGRLGSILPFVLRPSNGSPAENPGVDPFKSYANQAGPLPEKFAQMETTLGDAGSSSSACNAVSARAELLRQERERINREIASLENRSTSSESHYGGSSYGIDMSDSSSQRPTVANIQPVPMGSSINDQLASLREQIRQIEQTYSQSALAGVSEEPPPSYDGPPPVTGGSRPLPNAPPGNRVEV
ncbi:hypothetical protein M413DRAFT_448454 [Hebeloma cylindrosporum]|uniref:Mid2 domain-containing protein n=1 Tax=Hebeloma cylindrosporum TaxID=76867 RepID=A0A0C3BKZ0_HEBCY|nr:hypothetical protein M413DRAFT_448454 [Hebeloma cylindrosporum h7]